jgi:hypothetical protein
VKNFLFGFISGAIIIFMIINLYFQSESKIVIDNKLTSSPKTDEVLGCPEVVVYQKEIKEDQPLEEKLKNNNEDRKDNLVEEITNFQTFVRDIPNSEILTYAPNTFKNEPVDANWASSYQLTLDEYFRNEPELGNLIPQTIECKTSICKISFAITDNHEQNAASTKFLNVLKTNKNNIPVQVLFGNNPEALDIYLPRSDKGFFSKSIN